jgi:predicted MFS family arabinose efflux permease
MATVSTTDAGVEGGQGSGRYRLLIILLLFLAYMFNYVDRILISIVQEPIKTEFGLSDFEVGILGGPAFAVVYTLAALPIARLVERYSRRNIIAAAMAVFSVMTATCGLATAHIQLLLCRMGVAIGEAGLAPASQSVIADYFPLSQKTRAIAGFSLGVPAGALLATFAGGVIAQHLGWRAAFITFGAAGLVLTVVLRLVLKEPVRIGASSEVPSLKETLAVLFKKSSYRHLVFASMLTAITSYGVGQYLTSFFLRAHDLALSDASKVTGLALGLFAGIATFASGWIADRFILRSKSILGNLPAFGLVAATPLYVIGFTASSLPLAVCAVLLGAGMHYLYVAPMYTIAQGVAPPRMRGTGIAVLLFSLTLLGYGLGPPSVGAISDALSQMHLAGLGLTAAQCVSGSTLDGCAAAHDFGLKWAMIAAVCVQPWAALHFWLAGRRLQTEWVG